MYAVPAQGQNQYLCKLFHQWVLFGKFDYIRLYRNARLSIDQ